MTRDPIHAPAGDMGAGYPAHKASEFLSRLSKAGKARRKPVSDAVRPPNTEFSGEPAALPSLVRCNSSLGGSRISQPA
jgi:hypothetical protein